MYIPFIRVNVNVYIGEFLPGNKLLQLFFFSYNAENLFNHCTEETTLLIIFLYDIGFLLECLELYEPKIRKGCIKCEEPMKIFKKSVETPFLFLTYPNRQRKAPENFVRQSL